MSACAGGDAAAAPETSVTAAPTPSVTAASPSPATTVSPSPEPSAAPEPSADPAFDGTVVEVQFTGGEVRTAEPRVAVPLGGQVRLVVTSDVVDEVHVHGVDEYVPLAPGAPAIHDFTASIPGIFEVEMHEAGDLLFTLQVEP